MPRVSSNDVARRAGVSRATVSYVLNDRPDKTISAATRRRVLEAARELGYIPRAAAAALSAGRSHIVVLVEGVRTPAPAETVLPLGSVSGLLRGALAREVRRWGMTLLSCGVDTPMVALLGHVDPALVIAPDGLTPEDVSALDRAGCLHVDRQGDDGHLAAFVATGAPCLQMEHLAARGHRHLAYLSTSVEMVTGLAVLRRDAARQTCSDLGLAELVEHRVGELGPQVVDEMIGVLRGWVAQGVTAVACFNDLHATLVLAAARRLGLAVPGDIAVIGVDDEPTAALTDPPLTTVGFDMVAFASHLAALGRAALDGATPPVARGGFAHLVERASV